MKKLWDNIFLFGERKNLVQVCNSVANLAEGIPLAGNGNISHSDQSDTEKSRATALLFFCHTFASAKV